MFVRWQRMDEACRQRVWGSYGWFCMLTFCGSLSGAAAWGAWLQYLVLFFTANHAPAAPVPPYPGKFSLQARADVCFMVFLVAYAIEFTCVSVAKLLVLDRMMDFALITEGALRMRWAVVQRMVMRLVVAGNVVGLGGNIASAVYFKQVGDLDHDASLALAANNSLAAANYVALGNQKDQAASAALSVQQFCEVSVLLIIIVAFAVAGALCTRQFRFVPGNLRHMVGGLNASSRHLHKQIVLTVAVVFVTFILRAAFSSINSLANVLQNNGECSSDIGLCAATCYNT